MAARKRHRVAKAAAKRGQNEIQENSVNFESNRQNSADKFLVLWKRNSKVKSKPAFCFSALIYLAMKSFMQEVFNI